MNVPEHHTEEGNLILNPPPSGVVPVTQALSSPPKKRISVKAKIIQEEELRNVEVKGQQVPIETITVADESGQGKVTLWRDCANAEVRPGDHLEITDVVTNTYNNITTLSTTARSRVKKCEAPTVSKLVTIEGVSVSGQTAELLLDDGTCLSINTNLLHQTINNGDPIDNLEECTKNGPIMVMVTYTGDKITNIQKDF